MTRIDEIKERMRIYHNADESDLNDMSGAVILVQDNATEDIEYLLSRLEIADKALEDISSHALHPAGIASKALQQIRS